MLLTGNNKPFVYLLVDKIVYIDLVDVQRGNGDDNIFVYIPS